jgi:hypothetical protein
MNSTSVYVSILQLTVNTLRRAPGKKIPSLLGFYINVLMLRRGSVGIIHKENLDRYARDEKIQNASKSKEEATCYCEDVSCGTWVSCPDSNDSPVFMVVTMCCSCSVVCGGSWGEDIAASWPVPGVAFSWT